jgi:hypothetical protein
MGTFPNISLPVSCNTSISFALNGVGNAFILDAANRAFMGKTRIIGANNADFTFDSVSGTTLTDGFVTATAPMTWATGDVFEFQFIYEAAA